MAFTAETLVSTKAAADLAAAARDAARDERDGRDELLAILALLGLRRKFATAALDSDAVGRVLTQLVTRGKAELRSLTVSLADGAMTVRRWADRMAANLAPRHYAATLARLQTPELAPVDRSGVAAVVAAQLGFLGRFASQIQSGLQLLDGTALARAVLYAGAAWQTAHNVFMARAAREGFGQGRRVLSAAANCSTCIAHAALGWVPLVMLPPLGDSECQANCRCWIEVR